MGLADYVTDHTLRGACMCGRCVDAPENPEDHQPDGHTADLIFFKVSKANEPTIEAFKSLVETEFPHWLDGKEHGYMEMGADIGDQGLALMAMGLGSLLGVWELLTPEAIMSFLPADLKMQMAGQGMISIKA